MKKRKHKTRIFYVRRKERADTCVFQIEGNWRNWSCKNGNTQIRVVNVRRGKWHGRKFQAWRSHAYETDRIVARSSASIRRGSSVHGVVFAERNAASGDCRKQTTLSLSSEDSAVWSAALAESSASCPRPLNIRLWRGVPETMNENVRDSASLNACRAKTARASFPLSDSGEILADRAINEYRISRRVRGESVCRYRSWE